MFGIAGIYQPLTLAAGMETLSRMLVILAHRGPDGDGVWTDPLDLCVLGHKRLAIIDPEGGHQPLTNGRRFQDLALSR